MADEAATPFDWDLIDKEADDLIEKINANPAEAGSFQEVEQQLAVLQAKRSKSLSKHLRNLIRIAKERGIDLDGIA